MLSTALHFLLTTIFNLLTLLFLLRFFLQLFGGKTCPQNYSQLGQD
jgi:hypothetical protein